MSIASFTYQVELSQSFREAQDIRSWIAEWRSEILRGVDVLLAEDGEMPCAAESGYRRGVTLSVPIMWTTPEGGEPPIIACCPDPGSRQSVSRTACQ